MKKWFYCSKFQKFYSRNTPLSNIWKFLSNNEFLYKELEKNKLIINIRQLIKLYDDEKDQIFKYDRQWKKWLIYKGKFMKNYLLYTLKMKWKFSMNKKIIYKY